MDQALKVLSPGREIVLSGGVKVKVFPVGFKHLRSFVRQISNFMAVIGGFKVDPKRPVEDQTIAILKESAPQVALELIDLVAECVTFESADASIDDLPHWDVAPIVAAWIEESFGEESKIRPWVEAIASLSSRFGKGKVKALSQMLSGTRSSS